MLLWKALLDWLSLESDLMMSLPGQTNDFTGRTFPTPGIRLGRGLCLVFVCVFASAIFIFHVYFMSSLRLSRPAAMLLSSSYLKLILSQGTLLWVTYREKKRIRSLKCWQKERNSDRWGIGNRSLQVWSAYLRRRPPGGSLLPRV